MMALCRADAEEMPAILGDTSDGYGLVIHLGKMANMVVQPTMDDNNITYHLIPISHVTSFKYLGVSINHTPDDSKEVRMRIDMGNPPFRGVNTCVLPNASQETKAQLSQARIMS